MMGHYSPGIQRIRLPLGFALSLLLLLLPLVYAENQPPETIAEPAAHYIVRDSFYLSPAVKLKFNTYESEGFVFTRDRKKDWNSEFSVVSGFDGSVLETYVLKNVTTIDGAKNWVKKNGSKTKFNGVEIQSLAILDKFDKPEVLYWVGQKAFQSRELAEASILSAKTAVESQGGQFDRALELVEEFAMPQAGEPAPVTDAMIDANYAREEKYAVRVMEWLDIGERLYGPLHTRSSPWGEKLLWQSYGETSFRTTNLETNHYSDQVGFWTNKFVFKGIWGPFDTTLDPYIELTPVAESNGVDFKSYLKLVTGVQWYPLTRNAALQNFKPGGIPLLDFVRNYRFFVQYLVRENLKEEIIGSKDTDLWAGVDIFYEWGLSLPPLGQKPYRTKFVHYLQDYVWGEYFGSYRWEQTDFSSVETFQSWILNSSLILGVKWPIIPLPANLVNNDLTFMPYLRFEHVNNLNHTLFYQNYLFTAVGLRLMPFRSYQFSENEWLFKTKLFAEYIGPGGAIRWTANTPTDTPGRDLRFGIQFSYRRF